LICTELKEDKERTVSCLDKVVVIELGPANHGEKKSNQKWHDLSITEAALYIELTRIPRSAHPLLSLIEVASISPRFIDASQQ
jgi:hypothetical protein